MTRGVADKVQDNMLNPAYFGIQLTVPMVLSDFASDFKVLGSSPPSRLIGDGSKDCAVPIASSTDTC